MQIKRSLSQYGTIVEKLLEMGAGRQLENSGQKIKNFSPNNLRRVILGLDGIVIQQFVSTGRGNKLTVHDVNYSEQLIAENCDPNLRHKYPLDLLKGIGGTRVYSSIEEIIVLRQPSDLNYPFIHSGIENWLDVDTLRGSFKRLRAVTLVTTPIKVREFVDKYKPIIEDPLKTVTGAIEEDKQVQVINGGDYLLRTSLRPQFYDLDEEGSPLHNYFQKVKEDYHKAVNQVHDNKQASEKTRKALEEKLELTKTLYQTFIKPLLKHKGISVFEDLLNQKDYQALSKEMESNIYLLLQAGQLTQPIPLPKSEIDLEVYGSLIKNTPAVNYYLGTLRYLKSKSIISDTDFTELDRLNILLATVPAQLYPSSLDLNYYQTRNLTEELKLVKAYLKMLASLKEDSELLVPLIQAFKPVWVGYLKGYGKPAEDLDTTTLDNASSTAKVLHTLLMAYSKNLVKLGATHIDFEGIYKNELQEWDNQPLPSELSSVKDNSIKEFLTKSGLAGLNNWLSYLSSPKNLTEDLETYEPLLVGGVELILNLPTQTDKGISSSEFLASNEEAKKLHENLEKSKSDLLSELVDKGFEKFEFGQTDLETLLPSFTTLITLYLGYLSGDGATDDTVNLEEITALCQLLGIEVVNSKTHLSSGELQPYLAMAQLNNGIFKIGDLNTNNVKEVLPDYVHPTVSRTTLKGFMEELREGTNALPMEQFLHACASHDVEMKFLKNNNRTLDDYILDELGYLELSSWSSQVHDSMSSIYNSLLSILERYARNLTYIDFYERSNEGGALLEELLATVNHDLTDKSVRSRLIMSLAYKGISSPVKNNLGLPVNSNVEASDLTVRAFIKSLKPTMVKSPKQVKFDLDAVFTEAERRASTQR